MYFNFCPSRARRIHGCTSNRTLRAPNCLEIVYLRLAWQPNIVSSFLDRRIDFCTVVVRRVSSGSSALHQICFSSRCQTKSLLCLAVMRKFTHSFVAAHVHVDEITSTLGVCYFQQFQLTLIRRNLLPRLYNLLTPIGLVRGVNFSSGSELILRAFCADLENNAIC